MSLTFNPFTGTFDFVGSGGGGGTPAPPDTSVQFNNSGAFGGDANLTWNGTKLNAGVPLFPNAARVGIERDWVNTSGDSYVLDVQGTLTSTDNVHANNALFNVQSLVFTEGTHPIQEISGGYFSATHNSTGTLQFLQTLFAYTVASGGNITGDVAAIYTENDVSSGTITAPIYGHWFGSPFITGGTISGDLVAVQIEDQTATIGGTNAAIRYMAPSSKTFLLNADGSMSLGGGALTVATSGAMVSSSTVTATDFIVSGSAFKSDTTTGHTALYQAYDVDDATYRTFGTATNGDTPTFAWAAPSGGTLSGNFTTLQIGGVNVLTTTGSGASLTFPGTLAIVTGKTFTVDKTLTLDGTDSTTMTFPASSDTVAGLAATQTFTNKRITKRVVTASDATSITPNSDNADITYQANTQAAGTLTINADTGTPTNGQSWVLKLKSTNVQTFSWNALYVGGAIPLPTTSSGGTKIDYFCFIYDSVTPKWDYTGTALAF